MSDDSLSSEGDISEEEVVSIKNEDEEATNSDFEQLSEDNSNDEEEQAMNSNSDKENSSADEVEENEEQKESIEGDTNDVTTTFDTEEDLIEEEEKKPEGDVNIAEIFGSESSDNEDSDEDIKPSKETGKKFFGENESDADGEIDLAQEVKEREEGEEVAIEEEEEPEVRTIYSDTVNIQADLGNEMYLFKLPNFLSIEKRPFDPNTYEDDTFYEDLQDEEGRTRLKLKVENSLRWRYAKDAEGNELMDDFGDPVKESNARLVRWSDDSLSLHLGDEIFDIHKMALLGDHNHLFVRQGNGLIGQGIFRDKLAFRPHSIHSFTHKKMTMNMVDRSNKTQKIKVITAVKHNPDVNRDQLIKQEEERLRASIRRESKQRRIREKQQSRNLSSSYLEDRSDEEGGTGVSLAAIKAKYKPGNVGKRKDRPNIYSSSSSELSSLSDSDDTKKKRKAQESDSDSETEVKKKKARIFSDDEDED